MKRRNFLAGSVSIPILSLVPFVAAASEPFNVRIVVNLIETSEAYGVDVDLLIDGKLRSGDSDVRIVFKDEHEGWSISQIAANPILADHARADARLLGAIMKEN